MRLTGYAGKVKAGRATKAVTTIPGFVNGKGQEVVARTGMRSTSFAGQVIYKLRCRGCSAEYGSNGCDISERKCPECQGGVKGGRWWSWGWGLFG